MDPRFLALYERELKHVRELGGEFARMFPKVAGRLGLDGFGCADPYVERLIEAFAFLAARVQQKQAASEAQLAAHMLELLYPGYLAPTPSMAVVQMEPNHREGSLAEGVVVPRGASLRAALGAQQTACEYRTAQPVTLWPIELTRADYRTQLGELCDVGSVPAHGAQAALRLVLRAVRGATFDALPLDRLPLFLRGGDELAMRLYEQLHGASQGLMARAGGEPPAPWHTVAHGRCVGALGFGEDEALLPTGVRASEGHRLLHELFVFPQRFMFAELGGLRRVLTQIASDQLELVILFDRADPRLDGAVRAEHFALFCTPAINLFPRSSDRIHLDPNAHELHVVPDRARPLDFEVHSVVSVQGHGRGGEQLPFLPLYAPVPPFSERGAVGDAPGRFCARREPRMRAPSILERSGGAFDPYVPTETFLSIVDGEHGASRPSLRQLSAETLCTNRALPLLLVPGKDASDFHEQAGAPIASIRCVAGPTPPRSSPVQGELAWSLLSHLSLDYLALMQRDGQAGAPLRELLGLYAGFADRSARAWVEGIVDVQMRSVVRPLPCAGPIAFGRGVEVTLTCDERAYPELGAFLPAAVLARFFARYASINSFTETVLCTRQRGEVMRWEATAGRRPVL